MTLEEIETKEQCPPILFVIFNRPDLTQQVFARIQEVKPAQLFVAADGPRDNHPDDMKLCVETRRIIEQVDWPCEIHTMFRETNLGCRKGVSLAIDWFFENVESGIILEDDCLPDLTFFHYCTELLSRYKNDERIMVISGDNFQQGIQRTQYSYYYSHFPQIWGWATWRRAWRYYDDEMSRWPELSNTSWLIDIHDNQLAAKYWCNIFNRTYRNEINSWGYRWLYSCWVQGGLSVSPEVNLVSNIGFDLRATHTKSFNRKMANLPAMTMQFPLRHPPSVVRQIAADQFTLQTLYLPLPPPSLYRRAVRKIKNSVRKIAIKIGVVAH
ncbi:MAG TPA: hypothetical protein PKC99_14140 [Anaerolineales bacterium]|nr:glycosyltransferase family 2 protein [Chloroflexota bacterium]NOG76251.1 glycosyltransferase family 2 protein [Chloroflexota bacterium]WKZ52846.1 MAG: hypothetical protein QY324_08435 [Anaerolineales bacterium]GIK10626.1 MAG: hemolytic protein HlpA [Chloroflexota bacterium]HMN00147.1 hypothetical protein [Anaerolineales bacterium]